MRTTSPSFAERELMERETQLFVPAHPMFNYKKLGFRSFILEFFKLNLKSNLVIFNLKIFVISTCNFESKTTT